ncbi:hypothetical protein ACFL2V_21785 [Pseudomonadota bacterium]
MLLSEKSDSQLHEATSIPIERVQQIQQIINAVAEVIRDKEPEDDETPPIDNGIHALMELDTITRDKLIYTFASIEVVFQFKDGQLYYSINLWPRQQLSAFIKEGDHDFTKIHETFRDIYLADETSKIAKDIITNIERILQDCVTVDQIKQAIKGKIDDLGILRDDDAGLRCLVIEDKEVVDTQDVIADLTKLAEALRDLETRSEEEMWKLRETLYAPMIELFNDITTKDPQSVTEKVKEQPGDIGQEISVAVGKKTLDIDWFGESEKGLMFIISGDEDSRFEAIAEELQSKYPDISISAHPTEEEAGEDVEEERESEYSLSIYDYEGCRSKYVAKIAKEAIGLVLKELRRKLN